jgi:hypothetical protein
MRQIFERRGAYLVFKVALLVSAAMAIATIVTSIVSTTAVATSGPFRRDRTC